MLKIRTKNFQSLVDCELLVDGFTTLTGKNNTGKSALIRSVFSAFTNPTYAPIANDLTKPVEVELISDDFQLKWTKGKGFNSYTINGISYDNIGTNLPIELRKLGICDIDINGKTIYPQFAMQLTGQLFLTNLSGAYLSEAVADTNSVQLLTNAYKRCEKERKNAASELKVRTKDLTEVKKTITQFVSFPETKKLFLEVQEMRSYIESTKKQLGSLKEIRAKLIKSNEILLNLQDLKTIEDSITSLDLQSISTNLSSLGEYKELSKAIDKSNIQISNLSQFNLPKLSKEVEDLTSNINDLKLRFNKLWEMRGLSSRMSQQRQIIESSEHIPDSMVSVDQIIELKNKIILMESLVTMRTTRENVKKDLQEGLMRMTSLHNKVEEVKSKIASELKLIGKCPVCST